MDNLLAWVGGKAALFPFIQSKFPSHEGYVDVFTGGLNMTLNKLPSKYNIINDINNSITNVYECVLHPDKAKEMQELCDFPYSRKLYDTFQKIHGEQYLYQITTGDPERPFKFCRYPEVERAIIYIAMNRMSFNGKMQSYSPDIKGGLWYDMRRIIKDISRKFNEGSFVIENLHFKDLILGKERGGKIVSKGYDRDKFLLYLDPPYWITALTEGADYYEKVMTVEDHILLRDVLLGGVKKAKWILSYDDVPKVRSLYGIKQDIFQDELPVETSKEGKVWALLTPPKLQSAGSRANAAAGNQQTVKRELLIANYPLMNANTLF